MPAAAKSPPLTADERAFYRPADGARLADTMPLKASGPSCAVLMRAGTTQWADHCSGLPVVEARWRFVDGVTRLRWCADHADVLTRRDRCLQVRPLRLAGQRYAADVEG